MRPVALLTLLALIAPGCGRLKDVGKNEKKEQDEDAGAPDNPVEAAVKSEANGTLVATVVGANATAQIVRASASSRIAGALLSFPAGAFAADTDVTIEPVSDLTAGDILRFGFKAGVQIAAAGPAVRVSWASDEDAAKAYSLSLPAPAKPAGESKLVVLYERNVPKSPATKAYHLVEPTVVLEDTRASFSMLSYGLFQVVYMTGDLQSPDGNAGDEQVPTPVKVPNPTGAAPTAFKITAPTSEWVAAEARVKWEASTYADAFDVKVATDPGCTADARSVDNVVAQATDVKPVVNGDNYVCVFAKNQFGTTPASNNGFKIKADIQAPEVPSVPVVTLAEDNNVGVLVDWNAVTDAGGSGLSRYFLEVGHDAEETAEVFNADIVGETTKSIIGFVGQTYRARVRAVDAAGNESAFSAWSPAITR